MANILQKIAENKRREIDAEIRFEGEYKLPDKLKPTISMAQALAASPTGIIAEFKRRSPSKGDIHPMALVNEIVPGYEKAGATASSILTDTPYFGGSINDLMVAAQLVSMPLLRKEFIIDDRQVLKARGCGASAILLIASLLTRNQIEHFTDLAHSIGLEVLLELHSEKELDRFVETVDMVGVNNRDLATFHTDPQLSEKMASCLPSSVVKVAESGLTNIDEVKRLRDIGYRGFLIGETFMKHSDPALALRQFLDGTL